MPRAARRAPRRGPGQPVAAAREVWYGRAESLELRVSEGPAQVKIRYDSGISDPECERVSFKLMRTDCNAARRRRAWRGLDEALHGAASTSM